MPASLAWKDSLAALGQDTTGAMEYMNTRPKHPQLLAAVITRGCRWKDTCWTQRSQGASSYHHDLMQMQADSTRVRTFFKGLYSMLQASTDHMGNAVIHTPDGGIPVAAVLAPLRISFGNKRREKGARYTDIVLWYVPNDDLLAALTPAHRNRLEMERAMMRDLMESRQTREEICSSLPTPCYLGLCPTANGVVTALGVHPNPAGQSTTMEIVVNEPVDITLALYDIAGVLVRQLPS